MAKRKRKNGKFFKSLSAFFGGIFWILIKILPGILAVTAVAGIYLGVRHALFADSKLLIEKIDIHPPQAISIPRRQALEAKYLGKNILRTDLVKIAEELEKDFGVARVRVVRHLPSRLVIDVTQRKATAMIQFVPKGEYGVLSEDGMILDILEAPKPGLVLVEAFGLNMGTPSIGMKVKRGGLEAALDFKKAYETGPVADKMPIEKLSFDRLGNVSLYFEEGPQIRLGRKPTERLKSVEQAMALLRTEDPGKIEYIDLEFDNVIVKRKK